MARAVGTKRLDLVQIFLAEGMGYNLLAAMVGTGLGVLVSFGMSRIMAALFASFDVSISPYVTPRTMIISYALGVVLTFLTVTFSSWRVSQINIVRAIRDIPEPPPEKPMWKAHGIFSTIFGLIFKPGNGTLWCSRTVPWGRRSCCADPWSLALVAPPGPARVAGRSGRHSDRRFRVHLLQAGAAVRHCQHPADHAWRFLEHRPFRCCLACRCCRWDWR